MNLEELAKWAEWFRDRCGTKEDEARLTACAAACRELVNLRCVAMGDSHAIERIGDLEATTDAALDECGKKENT